jgi:predicted transposase YdaD
MLLKKHPEVGGAVVELRKMSWSERRRDRALAKEMWRHDVATWKHYARQEGLAEGKAEGLAKGLAEGEAKGLAEGEAKGLAEGKAEVARKLKALGRPAAEIAAATGLAIEEIKKL